MTQVDEWTPMVLEKLTTTLGDDTPKLIALLKDTGAILSGGFVLNSIAKYYIMGSGSAPDLDIYVPLAHMPRFLGTLVNDTLKFRAWDNFDATIYCRSFLRKNGIRRVHTFSTTNDKSLDVMAVRSRKTVQDVCSNFDLTFCQVWFDGTHVFATHPDHIREKKGYLQGEYIDTFVQGNTFLKDRIRKYQTRGFKITYDPSSTSIKLPVIADVLQNIHKCSKEEAREALLPIWFQRAATRWLASSKENRNKFALPFGKSSSMTNQVFAPGTKQVRAYHKIDTFRVPDDEGYDSESMDSPRLTELAVAKYETTATELASKPLDPALVYSRQMFGMLQAVLTEPDRKVGYTYHTLNYKELLDNSHKHIEHFKELLRAMEAGERVRGWRGTIEQLKERIQRLEHDLAKPMVFVDYLQAQSTRSGTDFAADDGQLYDIHNHPMDAATTRDSLEGYLEQFIRMSDGDKEKGVPCYHKPTPAVRGQPEPATNCTQPITMKEIETIVSYEFFKRFSAPQPFKTGLNVVMPVYEAALPNIKSLEEGYGDEYHETMCPFCLQTMSRGEGCSYMTHENPKRLDTQQSPFCQKEFVVQSILDKYTAMAKRIDGEEMPLHIEVCVECGRPCSRHQHFDITSDEPKLVAALRKPDPANPGRMIADYATCAGGGRTELFARMLAVRDVYKKGGHKNPKAEREAAAAAADAAAKDPSYLARGQAIVNMPPADRKFNTKVPAIKKYDDPAYEDVSEEDAQAAANAARNEAANAAIAAIVAAPLVPAAPPAAEIVYPEGFPDFLRTKLRQWLNNGNIEPIDPTSLPDIEKIQIARAEGINVEDEDNVRAIRQLGEQQINATRRSSVYTLWKATNFRVNRPAFDKAYANVVFHYWIGFTIKLSILNLTIDELMRVVMGARSRRARDRGEALPAQGIVYADGTPEAWKTIINERVLLVDVGGFQSSPTRVGLDLTAPILARLNFDGAQKSAIYDGATETLEETSQYAIWRRLKHEETRQVPPPRPENIKTAVQQITADCIILFMMKVRQLLDARGFPDAVVPRNAVLGGPAAAAVAAAAAAVVPAAAAAAAAVAAAAVPVAALPDPIAAARIAELQAAAAEAREALPRGDGAAPAAPIAPAANVAPAANMAPAAAAVAPAANVAQLPVLYPADNTLVARPRIRQGLADPPREREGPLEHMFTWVLETDVTFGDGIDDVLFNVSEGIKQTAVYRNWKEVNDAIRAGGIVPNNYNQLWANVCLKYTEVYLAQVAAVQQGGRKARKNHSYKRRNGKTRVQRSTIGSTVGGAVGSAVGGTFGRTTYKKQKVQRNTRRNKL